MAQSTPRWPAFGDVAGWAKVVALGKLPDCPPEIVVGALRECFLDSNKRLVDALATHVSDVLTRYLRRLIATYHPNRGEDIIERAHCDLMASIFDPASTDGDDLVEAFFARARFRGVDALRAEGRYHDRILLLNSDEDGEPMFGRSDVARGSIDVNQAIASIPDPNHRLAFRLYMEGMRIYRGDPCVASVLGCSPRTAARWITQAKRLLAAEYGC